MDAACRKILENRHGVLSNVQWSSKLARMLVSERVLPKQFVSEIERESKNENKVYILLAKLPQQKGNDVFANFCDVLEMCSHGDVAAMLKHDKEQINISDKREESGIPNLDEFIDVLKDIELTELLTESDGHLRKRRHKQFKDRLTCLGRHVLKQQQRTNELRSHILAMLQTSSDMSSKTSSSGSVGSDSDSDGYTLDLSDARGFAKLSQIDENKDREVITEIRHAMGRQEESEEYLKQEIKSKCEKIEEYERRLQQLAGGEQKDLARTVGIMEDMLLRQDKELTKLHFSKVELEQKNRENEDKVGHVTMTAGEYEGIMAQLKAFNRRVTTRDAPMPSLSEKGSSDQAVAVLKMHVNCLLDQMEKLRKRVGETATRIVELETEQKTIISEMGIRLDEVKRSSLGKVVRRKLSDSEKDKEWLRNEVEDLKEKLEIAEGERDQLLMKVELLTRNILDGPGPASNASVAKLKGEKTRRESAPVFERLSVPSSNATERQRKVSPSRVSSPKPRVQSANFRERSNSDTNKPRVRKTSALVSPKLIDLNVGMK